MAGIGWKLQALIDRGTLRGAAEAYLTGVAVTSAPWLLTTAVLVSLRVASRGVVGSDFGPVEHVITVVYALTVALSSPVHVVVSRYAADRLYERRAEAIAAPLRRALAATLVGFGVLGAIVMGLMRLPLTLAVPGTMLAVVVGAQWLMMAVGGGMASPTVVLRAFVVGAPLSVATALVLGRVAGLGSLGYLYGFGGGQLLTLVILLRGVAVAIPAESDESARLRPAFAEYRLLALSSLAYHASIWLDKLLVWAVSGAAPAALYAAVAALAWFSVIPSFAWIYVQIETGFYRTFRGFFGDLERGAPLAALERGAAQVRAEAMRILRGAALVQLGVTALAAVAAPSLVAVADLPAVAVTPFRLAAVGASLQVMTLLGLLLLYYFDLRRDAVIVSLTLLGADLACTSLALAVGVTPALGYLVGCAVACATAVVLVRRRLRSLLVDTFQGQPFG